MVSAILICAEYLRLGIFYRSQHIILIISFAIKSSFVVIEIALAIGFGVCQKRTAPEQRNASAVLEWGMLWLILNCMLIADGYSDCTCFYILHPLIRH